MLQCNAFFANGWTKTLQAFFIWRREGSETVHYPNLFKNEVVRFQLEEDDISKAFPK
jgi:hypothetical protein